MQVSKIAESGTDYRKFYINNGAKIMRLRAETKCALLLHTYIYILLHLVLKLNVMPVAQPYAMLRQASKQTRSHEIVLQGG